jgi:glutathione S-transferase
VPEPAKLYVILGSHACRTGMLLFQHKRIPYRLVTIPTGMQRALPAFGFPGGTVPAVDFDGEIVQTNPAIARRLDELQPEPPLFPSDDEQRRQVEEAERWGDDEFQMSARRIALEATMHGLEAMDDCGDDGRLGPLLWPTRRGRRRGMPVVRRVFDVNRRTAPELLAALPAQLDRIDAWIEAGVLGGEQLYAADYVIAPSVALLTYRNDLRPDIESRPAGALADRILPHPSRRVAA